MCAVHSGDPNWESDVCASHQSFLVVRRWLDAHKQDVALSSASLILLC